MFTKKDVHSKTHFLTSLVVPFYRFLPFLTKPTQALGHHTSLLSFSSERRASFRWVEIINWDFMSDVLNRRFMPSALLQGIYVLSSQGCFTMSVIHIYTPYIRIHMCNDIDM